MIRDPLPPPSKKHRLDLALRALHRQTAAQPKSPVEEAIIAALAKVVSIMGET